MNIFARSAAPSVTAKVSSQTRIRLTAAGNTMTATLADNEATRELTSLLEKGDITIRMSDYGGFEKVGELPQFLPTSSLDSATDIEEISAEGNNMVDVTYDLNGNRMAEKPRDSGIYIINGKKIFR